MPNSNDVASEMLWERVLSLLVVGASVLGGSAVLLIMALPPVLRISIVAERVLSGRRAKLSVERNVQQYVQNENRRKA